MKQNQDDSIPKEVNVIDGGFDDDSISEASYATSDMTFNSNFVSLESQPVIPRRRVNMRQLYKQLSYRKTKKTQASSVCSSQRSTRLPLAIHSSSVCSSQHLSKRSAKHTVSHMSSSQHSSKGPLRIRSSSISSSQ